MWIRVPDYYHRFHCLAGSCPHTCCEKWEVVIDEETALRYFAVPGSLGDRLRETLLVDEEGDFCFPLAGGRCPFLNQDNLCEIHQQLGQEATSVTCREHPRFTEDYGAFREISLSASCPAANTLLLETEAPLTFLEWETQEPAEEMNSWLRGLLAIRQRMFRELGERTQPLSARLTSCLLLAVQAQDLLEEEQEGLLPRLAADWQQPGLRLAEGLGLFPWGLRVLAGLETLDSDWREILRQGETGALLPQPEALLERIAGYFLFRYLLKAVNDGDLLGRVQLCVFGMLTVQKLAPVCGGLSEALRRFSCEVEHNEDNLQALLSAFCKDADLSLAAFFRELEGMGKQKTSLVESAEGLHL